MQKTHRQLKELMTNYGEIDYLFYDGCPRPEAWCAAELHAELRKLQPGLLISCRCGLNEDVFSSEQNSTSHDGVWESCYTLNGNWGYTAYDHDWKTPGQVIDMLMLIRHTGGNLLLNVGPKPDGTIQPEAVSRLKAIGAWLKVNGEAVYGKIEPHPFEYKDQEISVGKGNTVYIMLLRDWPKVTRWICGIENNVRSITLLETGEKINFEQNHDKIKLVGLPDKSESALPRILKIELDGKPRGIHNPMWPENNFRVC